MYNSLGPVDLGTVEKVEEVITDEERARQARVAARPLLSEILNLHDFEVCSLSFEQMVSFLTLPRLLVGWSCQRKRGRIILRLPMMRSPTAKTTLLSTGKPACIVYISFLRYLTQRVVPSSHSPGCHQS